MAVTAFFYGNAFISAFNAEIDVAGTVKCMLLDNTHTPAQDTHNYVDDVVADEVSGTGYTAGGPTLTTVALTYDGATNTIKLDADNVSLGGSTITARYAVIYVDTGVDATSPLIALVDFGEDVISTAGVFSITWDAAGIATVTVA